MLRLYFTNNTFVPASQSAKYTAGDLFKAPSMACSHISQTPFTWKDLVEVNGPSSFELYFLACWAFANDTTTKRIHTLKNCFIFFTSFYFTFNKIQVSKDFNS